jgi:hypothetical protein
MMMQHLKPSSFPKSNIEHLNTKIEKLNETNWFSHVGASGANAKVANWDEALRLSDYDDDYPFGDYLQALANDVCGFASSQDRSLYNKAWGKGHDLVSKPLSKFLTTEVYSKIPIKKLSNYVKSGICGALTDQLTLALVYGIDHLHLETHVLSFTNGCFPCGYEGEYPSGCLIVY